VPKDIIKRSLDFAVRIIKLSKYLESNKTYSIANQILRSATSIGANLSEAEYAQSKSDFIHKNSIALKECAETKYWIELLFHSELIKENLYSSLLKDCEEILKILTTIVKKSKLSNKE